MIQIVLQSACFVLRSLFSAPLLLLAAWMFVFGTQRWTNSEYWKQFPPSFGCDDTVLLDKCTLQQLLYMLGAPCVLAVSALGLLALRSLLVKKDHRIGPLQQWGSHLLPPRCLPDVYPYRPSLTCGLHALCFQFMQQLVQSC
jgi:hypothetical protein